MADEQKILQVLKKEGALKTGDIAEKTGIDKKEVAAAIKKLKDDGKVVSPKRCFYGLK